MVATIKISGRDMADVISTLLSEMTLDEKIGQLNLVIAGDAVTGVTVSESVEQKIAAGAVGGMFGVYGATPVRALQKVALEKTRLKIPLLFGLDVIHGHRTIFPIPLGLSCSWDMAMIENVAKLSGEEAAAEGLHWVFSPMVDITRDPRWGRCAEAAGEDAYLGSRISAAMVRGYQENGENSLLACVKHFALYGAAEAGRDYNTADISRLAMYEQYFPPYKSAVDAGVASVMSSFNDVEGIPATGNKWLLTDVLRKQWGFDGFVVSDYTSVNEMTDHGMGDLQTVSALALKAGLDMDMVGEGFLTTLKKSLAEGKVSEDDITTSCARILRAKQKLGLFDNPFRNLRDESPKEIILSPKHRAAARDAAAKSCVLLKNDGNILPLARDAKIALIGPLADDKRNMQGTWSIAGNWEECVSVLQGMKNAAPAADITYALGANITDDPMIAAKANVFGEKVTIDPRPEAELIAEAVRAAEQAEVIVAVVGEAQEMSGEAASRADIGLPGKQSALIDALAATGKPLVMVFLSGRPLVIVKESKQAGAIVAMWFGGTEAGNGIADVLFGDYNPAGKLSMSFPYAVGQIPVYYNHRRTGRPYAGEFPGVADVPSKFRSRYLDIPNEPLYPFGYGLSYTTFAYSDITLSETAARGNAEIIASVTVMNTGAHDGEETVQLYVTDPVASITRPVRELKGFEKIALKRGESRTVSFTVTTDHLKFYDNDLRHDWEAGEFIIAIGPNSAQARGRSVTWEK